MLTSISSIKETINKNFRDFINLFKFVVKKFFQDNSFESASALTYTSLLSIVPLMAVSFYIVKGIPYFQEFWQEAQSYIFSHFVPATGREVQKYLKEFAGHAFGLTMIGSAFLAISVVILIYTIEQAFNKIWGVYIKRDLLSSIVLNCSLLFLPPVLIGASFAISSYIWSLAFVTQSVTNFHAYNFLYYLLNVMPFLLIWICFTFLYKVIPNSIVKIKNAMLGAFIAALLFEFSKQVFTGYVSGITLNSLIYGTFATIPFFMLWLYIAWLIILFGAQITNAVSYRQFAAKEDSESRFMQAYIWLYLLWQESKKSNKKYLTVDDLFGHDNNLLAQEPYKQLDILIRSGWIRHTKDGCYYLNKDLAQFNLCDFYNSVPWRLPNSHDIKSSGYEQCLLQSLYMQVNNFENLLKNTVLVTKQQSLEQIFIKFIK